jgi:UDP-N-acetylmuramoylalanine--D-glutamate ligase
MTNNNLSVYYGKIYFYAKMLAVYGRARVGNAVFELAQSVGVSAIMVDDADSIFDPSLYGGIIPSPGINPYNRAFGGGNTLSELDFASAFLPDGFTIVAITGTDGKSTTAWMLYQLLCAEYGSSSVWLSGNFEVPFSETVRLIRESGALSGYIVVEVSSFMANGLGGNLELILDLTKNAPGNRSMKTLDEENSSQTRPAGFTPNITIFTNFERDHLDWHDGIEDYFAAKMRLVERTRTRAYLGSSVYLWAKSLGHTLPHHPELSEFGISKELPFYTNNSDIFVRGAHICRLEESIYRGTHNALNLLSVVSVALDLWMSAAHISEHLPKLTNLPHRLELVGEYRGIKFVDDSKSTSAQSLRAGLSAYATKNVILIAGGHDKGDVFTGLVPDFSAKVRRVVCIGATAPAFMAVARTAGVPSIEATSMGSAVELALDTAEPGDTILLSPGCASFGMFRNYLDRAEQFRAAFSKLGV